MILFSFVKQKILSKYYLIIMSKEKEHFKSEGMYNPTNNPFRDEKNRWYTASLFFEMCRDGNTKNAIYTLYEVDREIKGKVYKSLKDAYVLADHIPGYEYEFATTYFGGWEHWLRVKSANSTLREFFSSLTEELEIRLKAEAAKDIIKISETETGATRLNANKWLSDKGWLATTSSKGRPSKADVQREAKIAAGVEKELEDDLNRIRLIK